MENTAHKEINRLQAELDKHCWIPVSERLPEEKRIYLIIGRTNARGRKICKIVPLNRSYKNNLYGIWAGITHWKPIILPEGD